MGGPTGARAKAWCLFIHAKAFLSLGAPTSATAAASSAASSASAAASAASAVSTAAAPGPPGPPGPGPGAGAPLTSSQGLS